MRRAPSARRTACSTSRPGPGRVALPAARTGARVVASDLTPELLTAGRREADADGLVLDWIEADAATLPFADGEFDVVCSANQHDLLARPGGGRVRAGSHIPRPGGRIGLTAWAPGSWTAEFWATLTPFLQARQAKLPSPLNWGDEEGLRKLLGDGIASLELQARRR